MAVPVSSLSIAVHGISEFLANEFKTFSEQVSILTDTPQRASEKAKGGDKHFLNLFTYRISPAGFQPDTTSNKPFFIRIHVLLTPFLTDQGVVESDADMRILGHAIRVLGSNPVVPPPGLAVLPGGSASEIDFRFGPNLDYRLEAVLQSPAMEELNHIWTTQGGELAYRLSAAYEFALIPIEPMKRVIDAGPVRTGIVDVHPEVKPRKDDALIEYGDDPVAIPLRGVEGQPLPLTDVPLPPPPKWLPVVLFADGEKRTNTTEITPGRTLVDVAIAGLPGTKVKLEVSWIRADGSADTQDPAQVFTIRHLRIDDRKAVEPLMLKNPRAGDAATVLVRPVDGSDDLPVGNTLSIATKVPQ